MKKGKMAAMLMVITGRAGVRGTQGTDAPDGHWNGLMMRDGWERPLHLDIESEAGAWRGTWRAPQQGSDMALREVDVRGEDVRFDTDNCASSGA